MKLKLGPVERRTLAAGIAGERVVLTPKGHVLLNQQHRARAQNNAPRPTQRNAPRRR